MIELRGDVRFVSRFWSRVAVSDGCWLWLGAVTSGGYGRVGYKNRHFQAHRVAYVLAHGAIPPGLNVCHVCDVRRCVRREHLFLGTQADNVADMVRKGRNQRDAGDVAHHRKLTNRQVNEIRRRYADGRVTQHALAEEYGVHQTNISLIIRGHSWA